MINGRQSTAARALLGWTLDDLARESGLVRSTVHGFENESRPPSANTVTSITSTLEKAGIEFTRNGVQLSNQIHELIGHDCYLRLLDDVASQLSKHKKPELLIFFGDDRVSPAEVIQKYKEMRTSGVAMRQLVEMGNTYLMGETSEYRYVPSEFFVNRVGLVYGDCFAYVVKGTEKRVLITRDAELAEAQRNLFNWVWSFSTEPGESNASEKF